MFSYFFRYLPCYILLKELITDCHCAGDSSLSPISKALIAANTYDPNSGRRTAIIIVIYALCAIIIGQIAL